MRLRRDNFALHRVWTPLTVVPAAALLVSTYWLFPLANRLADRLAPLDVDTFCEVLNDKSTEPVPDIYDGQAAHDYQPRVGQWPDYFCVEGELAHFVAHVGFNILAAALVIGLLAVLLYKFVMVNEYWCDKYLPVDPTAGFARNTSFTCLAIVIVLVAAGLLYLPFS